MAAARPEGFSQATECPAAGTTRTGIPNAGRFAASGSGSEYSPKIAVRGREGRDGDSDGLGRSPGGTCQGGRLSVVGRCLLRDGTEPARRWRVGALDLIRICDRRRPVPGVIRPRRMGMRRDLPRHTGMAYARLQPYRPDSNVSFNPIALATATSVENRGLPRGCFSTASLLRRIAAMPPRAHSKSGARKHSPGCPPSSRNFRESRFRCSPTL